MVGSLAAIVLLLIPASQAAAVGTPGTTYVLDINRGSTGRIIAISPKGKARAVPVDQPLSAPVGLTVDAQGYLIVAVSDGYNPTYRFPESPDLYACENGCGAVLRVNPDNGAAVVLSKGPYWSNPASVLLPPDGDITDGKNDYLLVADAGDWNIVKVDLSQGLGANVDGNQSYFFDNRNFLPPNSSKGGCEMTQACYGLRRPTDLAYDPRNHDVLVSNVGAYPESFGGGFAVAPALTGVPGCDDDAGVAGFSERGGYIVRLHPGSVPVYYCDNDLVAPRSIAAGSDGVFYISDPFSAAGTSFASIFTLKGRRIEPLNGGGLLGVPSGLAMNYAEDRILVADETSPGSPGGCGAAGTSCGGVIRINPDGGAMSVFAKASTAYRNPIDVAVDYRRAKAPPKPPRVKRKVNNLSAFDVDDRPGRSVGTGINGIASGFRLLSVYPVTSDPKLPVRVKIECIASTCKLPGGASDRFARVTGNTAVFSFPETMPLKGRFRVISAVKPHEKDKTVYRGFFREFRYSPGSPSDPEGKFNTLSASGCLKPGSLRVVRKGSHRNVVSGACR